MVQGAVMLRDMGKLLIFGGAALVILGVVLMFSDKVPLLGRLPGDISVKRGNFSFYFPITTCILASIVLSGIMYLISRK